MENEKPAQRERRPLDVFDPTEDGHTPHSLAEVMAVGQDLLDSFDRLQAALNGCMTPLNLNKEFYDLRKLRNQAAALLEPLQKAKEIVELDLQLATCHPDTVLVEDQWAPAEGRWGTLSPQEILDVRLRARQVGPEALTTYRQEIAKQPKVPALIHQQRINKKRAAARVALASMPEGEREARRAKWRAARQAPEDAKKTAAAQEST